MAFNKQITILLKKFVGSKFARVLIDFSLITFVAVIIFRNWIFTSEWPAGGDILGWISRSYILGGDMRWLNLWRPYSFGFVEGINSMDFFLALIYWSCGNAATTIKIFTFSSFLVAGFSMYAFAYRYSNNYLAALSASLIYTLNQWFFTQLTEGHVDIIFSYALFPVVLLLVDRGLRTYRTKDVLLTAMALSLLATGFHPEFVVIYGVFLVFFVLSHMLALTCAQAKNLHSSRKILTQKFVVIAVSFVLISSFWLIPFLLNIRSPYLSPTYRYPIEDAVQISYQNILDAFVLRAWEVWGYTQVIDLRSELGFPGFPVYALLLIIFSISIFTAFFHRDRYTIFFAFSTFISAIIAAGPNSPFESFFTWAWFNVPYFAVFRAASRWIAIAAFCHAFLVSVLVSLSTSYIKKVKTTHFQNVYFKKARLIEKKETPEVYVSAEVLNKAIKYLRRLLYYSACLLLILIFLSGFLSSFYFFSHGLQVYTPPKNYLKPYYWIANNPGDYKIVTVSNSPSEWLNLSYQESDFAHGGMLTTIGWGHDIGYDSSFIHDKPTLQDGGWNPFARDFVDYLRFHLARQSLTKNLPEMLGTLGYKFVVLPIYASDNIKTFFFNQEGVSTVFTNGSVIFENKFFTPRIFAANQYVIVIGGLEAFSSLCTIDNFKLDKTGLIFANQVEPFYNHILNDSDALVFVNSDIVDLIMLSLKEETIFEYASTYAAASLNHTKYWTNWPSWRTVGGFTLGRNTATTCGNNTMNIPFQISSVGTYDIWIRIGFADWRGELSVYVDETHVGKLRPSSNFWSKLIWLNLTRLELTSGQHIITLINDGTGWNDVDAIAVVNSTLFKQKSEEISNFLSKYQGRIIYLSEAESSFNYSQAYSVYRFPYEGYTLKSEGDFYSNIAPFANAFASSTEKIGMEPEYANDGRLDTRWSSAKGMPQWLELDWPTTQEIVAVEIYFENAVARRYAIETWNGENWEHQVTVENYEEAQYQFINFSGPVKTDKLRIYVTEATEFESVSIEEIKAYPPAQKPVWSVKFEVPKEGEYSFALRLATGPDFGSVEIATENKTFPPFTCFNNSTTFTWYEVTVPLNSGAHIINVTGTGKTMIDKAILYSRTLESNVSINSLFNTDTAQPDVSYEKVNPCKYIVHVNSTKPFILIFSDSYHPLWKAYVDGVEISPIIAYSFVNGFFINKTGQFDIIIYFKGQTYADIGLKISAISLIVTLAILLTPSNMLKKIEEKIMRGKLWITSYFKVSRRDKETTNT